ncbi:MAG: hydrogenase [Thiovulaceae bacterium]|nr:hydrogenase [Sulfurimonadaceae bacterium]MCW9025929.1 hydrogenase [Sulfurimonadaceae bacterium]
MKKLKVLWLSALSCNGNTHAFFNYPNLEYFLDNFEFIYHPVIDSEYSLEDIVCKDIECDILLVEGGISDDFLRANTPILDIIKKYAKKVKKIVSVGTCASFGGIFKGGAYNDVTGLFFDEEKKIDRLEEFRDKAINVSGCPVHPDILVNTLFSIKQELKLKLDNLLRPKEYFAYSIHNGCTRNEYFEYKVDNHKFGELEGCMFYEHGCQAPFTHGSCNKILWNEVNSKTRAGLPCMGCTEPSFPRENLFSTKKNMGIPQELPLGVNKRTYLTLAGITKAFTIERLQKKLIDD